MDLRGKWALVTGATGFIGRHLVERLVTQEGVRVRAVARNPEKGRKLAELGVQFVSGDITNPATLLDVATDCQLIFHAAAWVSERGTKRDVWAVNVSGTQNVIDAALASQIERFVHLSSCAVYGSLQQHNIDELTPTRMRGDLYGDSKTAAEAVVLRAYREHNLPIVIARPSQVYGPGSPQFTVRPVEMIKSGKVVLINGGRHLYKPIYIDNLIDGLILCAKVDAAVGEAINFTDNAPVPWRDFFGAYGRMLNVNSFLSAPFSLAMIFAYANEVRAAVSGKQANLNRRVVRALRSDNSFSNQKADTLLGWRPQVDFKEGMQRTESWLRDEGYLRDKE